MQDKEDIAKIKPDGTKSRLDRYLEIICDNVPAVKRTISSHGDISLTEYFDKIELNPIQAESSLKDLSEIIFRYAEPLIGNGLAIETAKDLLKHPVVLTANHHGVDYFAQSVQGSLLFAFFKRQRNGSCPIVPIFSCGNIPLDNLTYPMGLLIYHSTSNETMQVPKKLPVFPNRLRRTMVSVAGPINDVMLSKTKKQVKKWIKGNLIVNPMADSLLKILDEDYYTQSVLNLTNYSNQTVILNEKLWKRLFKKIKNTPKLIYLEMEEIVRQLLIADLANENSLVSCIFFDKELRNQVIANLNGKKTCWNIGMLIKRLQFLKSDSSHDQQMNGCGTIFFWGINSEGRRIPFYLDENNFGKNVLRGTDDKGKYFEIMFTKESICSCLKERQILPSVFTCFLELAFARKINCIGGYFQADYLPEIQNGIISSLRALKRYDEFVQDIENVIVDQYLSGMQTVMAKINDNSLIPAGPIEIIAGGGLSEDDIMHILSLNIKDAHLASLIDTVADVAPWAIESKQWQNEIASECFNRLEKRVVVKTL